MRLVACRNGLLLVQTLLFSLRVYAYHYPEQVDVLDLVQPSKTDHRTVSAGT